MELNSKDELLSVIEDLQSRLAVVEDSSTKKESEEKEEKEEKTSEEPDGKEEVESEDEIEKLLNV